MKKLSVTLLIIAVCVGCENSTFVSESPETESNVKLKSATQSRGSALAFDGDWDYIIVEDSPSLSLTTGFTISAWIFLNEYTEWASIVTKGDGGNNYTIHQSGPAGGSDFGYLRFTGTSPSLPLFLESETKIPLNEWHHVAVTFDGELLTFYFNGVEDGGGALEGPLGTNNEPLYIGVDFPGGIEFWNGALDEIKIWNEALSAKHVKTAMNGHSSPKSSSIVGVWTFSEGSGNTVYDRSKNENDGQLIGDVSWINN